MDYKNNIYYQQNKVMFCKFMDIVNRYKCRYVAIIQKPEHKDVFDWITSSIPLLNDNFYTIHTKVYWILHGIDNFPICDNTSHGIHRLEHKNIVNMQLGYRHHKNSKLCYCSVKCKYEDPKRAQAIRDKQKADMQNSELKTKKLAKTKATMLKRYNVEHFTNPEKRIQTCLKKYGVPSQLQCDEVKAKIRRTNLERFGTENPFGNTDIQAKIAQTNIKRYGVSNPAKHESIKAKGRNTCISRYGTCGVSWTYVYDGKSFDSGYEVAYYIQLKDTNAVFEYPSGLSFQYIGRDGKTHRYYPDFKVDGKPVEIKGKQFFNNGNLVNPYSDPNSDGYICNDKLKCMTDNNVTILTQDSLKDVFMHIQQKYNCKSYLDYIKQFRTRTLNNE